MSRIHYSKAEKYLAAFLVLLIAGLLSVVLFTPVRAQTITQLPGFIATSSPDDAITQRIINKAVKITGLSTGQCLTLNSHNILTTTACGSSSSASLATSTPWTSGSLAYVVNNGTVSSVATTTLAGNSQISISGTPVILGSSPLTLSITGDSIGDAQLAFNTGQNLTTLSSPTFAGLTVGSLSGVLKAASGVVSAAANGTDYTLITAKTCSGNDFVSAVTAAGVFTCTTPSTGGTGTVTSINAGSTGSTLTFSGGPVTTSGTINGELNLSHPNTWSALQQFGSGLTAYASSTIGDGTQIGGLTINGGATTTGKSYFSDHVGIGAQPSTGNLQVTGTTFLSGGVDVGDTAYYDNTVAFSVKSARTWLFNMYGATTNPILFLGQNAHLSIKTVSSGSHALLTVGDPNTLDNLATAHISIGTSGDKGLIIQGFGAGNIQEWQNASGGVLSAVDSSGHIGAGTSSPYKMLAVGGDAVIGAATAGGTLGDLYLPKLGTAAGSFIAVDANGKVIATTTPVSAGGVLSLAQTYGTAQTGALTLATTSNTTNGITSTLNITNVAGAFTFSTNQSGTLTVGGGGTGQSSFTAGNLLYGSGSGAISNVATTSATLGLGLSGALTTIGGSQTLSIATSSLYTGTTGQFPYFSGTNTITATSSIFLATNQRIGIGTTSPSKIFTVEGNQSGGIARFQRDTDGVAANLLGTLDVNLQGMTADTDNSGPAFTFSYTAFNSVTPNTLASFGAYREGANNTGELAFSAYNAGTPIEVLRLRNNSTGSVGIGTTTPIGLLDLAAYSNDKFPQLVLTDPLAAADSKHFYASTTASSGNFQLGTINDAWTAVSPLLTLTRAGNLGIGTTTPTTYLTLPAGSAGAPVLTFGDTLTGMFRSASAALGWAIAGVEKLTLNATGLGVASTTPWATLSVAPQAGIWPFSLGSTTASLFGVSDYGAVTLTANQPATSTAISLDWSKTGQQVEYRIGLSATTITLLNATTSQYWGTTKRVWICNPGGTAGALTWAGVEWIGTAPTQTTTANQCDIYSFNVTRATSTSAYKVAGAASAGFQ